MQKKCVIVIVIAFLVTACSGTVNAPVGTRDRQPDAAYHVVQKGEGLYFISWQYGVDYMDLARWNSIDPPYTIYPGQKIYLKPRYKPRGSTGYHPRPEKRTARIVTVKKVPKKVQGKPAEDERDYQVSQWVWPARGKLIRQFSANDNGKKGIAISGRPGDPVVATASGKVVYSGNGLVRYGQMVIIKHNSQYLSAYAHNRKLLVKEGESVKQGQKIAEMGSSGTNQVMLHFEIRKLGKPVNPLQYLKK